MGDFFPHDRIGQSIEKLRACTPSFRVEAWSTKSTHHISKTGINV